VEILILLVLAFAPAAFWLGLVYLGDRCKPEPKLLIFRTFFLGMLVSIPVAIIGSLISPPNLDLTEPLPLGTAVYVAFVVAGVVEELGKFLVLRLTVYRSRYFDEPVDGLVYAAAAALGFATLENIGYMITFGLEVILVRGIFSTVAHVLFGGLWGYPLALYKTGRIKNAGLVWAGLVGAMIAHGIFNLLLFSQDWYTLLVIPFFLILAAVFFILFRHANRICPYTKYAEKPDIPSR